MNLCDRWENTPYATGCALGKRALQGFGCNMETPWLYRAFLRCCLHEEPSGINGAAVKHLKRVMQTN